MNEYTADREAMEKAHPDLTPALVERLTVSLQECFLDHGYNQAYVLRRSAPGTQQLTDRQKAEAAITLAFSRRSLTGFEAVEIYLPVRVSGEAGLMLDPIEPRRD